MRKSISILMVFVIIVSITACGNTVERACGKADRLVADWHKNAYGGCMYRSEYESEVDGYATSQYWVTIKIPLYSSLSSEIKNSKYGDEIASSLIAQAKGTADEVSDELIKIFEGTDVSVCVILVDDRDYLHYTLLDGEEHKWN